MTQHVRTDNDGAITTIYYGIQPTDPEDWVKVDSDLLADYDGTAYLIAKAAEPSNGWDRDDGTIGIVKSSDTVTVK